MPENDNQASADNQEPKKSNKRGRRAKRKGKQSRGRPSATAARYPRHSVKSPAHSSRNNRSKRRRELCRARSATYVRVFNGPYRVEISSALKYGFLERPRAGVIAVTERARQAIRPQKENDDIDALRQAVLSAPEFSEVYTHYRGEYLPDGAFFEHALVDKFSIPQEKVAEFIELFLASLQSGHLVEKKDDKYRILDVAVTPAGEQSGAIKKLSSERQKYQLPIPASLCHAFHITSWSLLP